MSTSISRRRCWWRAAAGVGLLALAATLTAAGAAFAEVGASTPTVQAISAKAAWLAYAPPPPVPGVVCLVDSGVDANPDTEEAVIGSHELYPQTGPGDEVARLSPLVDGHPDGHGTLMAMLMAAPENGWGMVGLAPGADRVYNMKALSAGSIDFHDEIEALAIETCARLQASQYSTMLTINLSLGGEAVPEPTVGSEVEDAIAVAKHQGISVFAAAGNTGGALSFPAAYPGTISIGAADAGASPGTLCAFSARGAELLAPGCDTQTGGIEGAWQDTGEPNVSQGTSQADAIDASIDAAMRDYGPTLTAQQAEGCLISTAYNGEIDAAAAFTACGLEAVVREGTEAEPKPQASLSSQMGGTGPRGASTSTTVTVCANGPCGASGQHEGTLRLESFERACPRPQLARVTRRREHVRILTRRKVTGCDMQARVKLPGSRRWMFVNHEAPRMLRIQSPPGSSIEVRLTSTSGLLAPSSWMPARSF
jgi:hypothetical protein